jgi:hypothetical protein
MLLRRDDRGVLAIGQPSHAWISGQLARAWGNARFGAVEPYEEVCLAAEQHDIGMAAWDLEPTLNPDTGLPHSFIEMPLETHVALWTAGPRRLLAQSRYATLLASMHGARLYEMRDLDRMTPDQAQTVRRFLSDQRRLQDRLLISLRNDPATAAATASAADPETVKRNSDLIWTWDFMSLAVCLDWAPCSARNVPTTSRPVDLELTPTGTGRLKLDPWPFATETVAVHCEGRRLEGTYDSEEALQTALANAPWETAHFELRSA